MATLDVYFVAPVLPATEGAELSESKAQQLQACVCVCVCAKKIAYLQVADRSTERFERMWEILIGPNITSLSCMQICCACWSNNPQSHLEDVFALVVRRVLARGHSK